MAEHPEPTETKTTNTPVPWDADKSMRYAAHTLGIFQVALIILFASCSDFKALDSTSPGTITQGYQYFIGVEIMMFIGFGYLMTFMKCYGLGAVGFTMLITAIGLQWYVFCESFFHQIYWYNSSFAWHNVEINIYELLNALFGIAAVLISFGAVIGKIKPFQLVIMTILELAFHAFNYECILNGAMQVADVGGTYADHMFGAYFGLAVAWVLSRRRHDIEPANGYVADIFSLIGTLFLWIYWPSFVGGAAQADSVQQQRCIINTILALSASTISSFYLSSLFTHNFRYRPVDIQNATLAGGVAIGCIGNFDLNPVNAIFVGIASGLVSTFGYNVIQPFLYHKIGLHDTCGVHNLHAMPSVIGALASMILAGYKQTGNRNHDADVFATGHGEQAWRQFVSIFLVITWAIVSGLVTGYLLRAIEPSVSSEVAEYNDANEWEVAGDYHYLTHQDDPVEYLVELIRNGKETSDVELALFNGGKAATADDVKVHVSVNGKPRVDTSVHESQHGAVGGSRNNGSAPGNHNHHNNLSIHGSSHGVGTSSFHGSQHGAVGASRNHAGNVKL